MKKVISEVKFEVSNGRTVEARILPDGGCKLFVEFTNYEFPFGDYSSKREITFEDFIPIKVSEFDPNDKLLLLPPFRKRLRKAVLEGSLDDFYVQPQDASIGANGNIAFYKDGEPATGISYTEWEEQAKEFDKEHNSGLSTRLQYDARNFALLKKLVENGWNPLSAWYALTHNSSRLVDKCGYAEIKDSSEKIKRTGSKIICGFADLGNTYKILAKEEGKDNFWIAGTSYMSSPRFEPIAKMYPANDYYKGIRNAVGLVVCVPNKKQKNKNL